MKTLKTMYPKGCKIGERVLIDFTYTGRGEAIYRGRCFACSRPLYEAVTTTLCLGRYVYDSYSEDDGLPKGSKEIPCCFECKSDRDIEGAGSV